MHNNAVHNRVVQNDAVNNRLLHNDAVYTRIVHNNALHNRAVHNNAVYNRAVHNNAVHNEAVHNNFMPKLGIPEHYISFAYILYSTVSGVGGYESKIRFPKFKIAHLKLLPSNIKFHQFF